MADPESNEEAQARSTPPKVPDHELLRLIGEGGYGEVWLARNSLGTFRAVKVIHCGRFKDNERPYEREFTGLKNFEPISRGHEGLVDILQVGRNDDDGYFFYVMEIADGGQGKSPKAEVQSLKLGPEDQTDTPASVDPGLGTQEWRSYQPLTLEDKIRANGRLPVAECIRIAATLADALRYLHEHELVHRDIKPSNIIFVDGVPKLADVGLVARTDSARTFVGTEGFIPPEGPGTPRADIYSLGKCLYEMAMGKDRQAFPSPPTSLDELPDRKELLELNEVIIRACDPDPAERYQNAQAMLNELQLLQRGELVSRARTRRKRLRLAVRAAALAGTCALVAGLIWAVNYQAKPRILLQDIFDGPQLDTNFWTVGRAETRHEGRFGKPSLRVEQTGGEFFLQAKAESEEGWSVTQKGWLELKPDLRKLAPCRLEIELAGAVHHGSLTVDVSTGTVQPIGDEASGVELASLERLHGNSGAWPPTTMRIDLLPQSEAAVVYLNTNRLDDFDIMDLRGLPVWQLRFHCYTASTRGIPGGLAELRIKRVVVYHHPQPDCLIGRVIEVPSRWPVQDALIKDGSGSTLAKTIANGAFVTDRVPNSTPLTVEKTGHELLEVQALGAATGRSFVTVELRKNEFDFGDVVEVISSNDLATASFGAASIGFRNGTLNLLVHESEKASSFVPVDTVKHRLAFDSPDTLKRSYEPTIVPLGFAEWGTRLIGIAHWPGRVLNFSANPTEAIAELNHPDGSVLNWPRGCAFDGQWLWFIEHDFMNQRFALHALDLERMVITNSVKSVDRGIHGLAWDGKQFWISLLQGGVYAVDREAALHHGTIEMAKGRGFKGHYAALAFGQGYLWGLEAGTKRICKIKVTD